jgi:valyl-tRNA synthetase
MVPRGDRSGAVAEPYLTDQWYVRVEPLAKPAIEAVESGAIRFVPDNWSKTYFEWMYNIQDWCISRQLWWGHRIPAWYGPDGSIYVGRDEADARARNGLDSGIELRQDEDVLDTWFSSALWPFSTLDWPEENEALKSFYPTSVLVTGFDIIFFWVARMIMMGLKFAGDVPFREVYITGLVKDEDGHKMSKSRGNVMDPIDLIDGIDLESLVAKRTSGLMQNHLRPRIEKSTRKQFPNGIPEFGVDAIRFTFAALASTSRDIRFDLARVEGYRNFCNKLWNAARYVLMSVGDEATNTTAAPGLADRWIRSRFSTMAGEVRRHLDTYRFDLAARELYEFTWHEFCDWYLELSKPVLRDPSSNQAAATRRTLVDVLEHLLRAMHPLMPFITEAIWLELRPLSGRTEQSVMLAPYPDIGDFEQDAAAETEIEWVKGFLSGVRQIRGEMDIAPGRPLKVLLQGGDPLDHERARTHEQWLCELGRLSDITTLDDGDEPPPAATALLGEMRLLVPLAGTIDLDAERDRLARNLAKAKADAERTAKKLANENFTAKAPPQVVEKEQEKLAAAKLVVDQLNEQLEKLAQIEN